MNIRLGIVAKIRLIKVMEKIEIFDFFFEKKSQTLQIFSRKNRKFRLQKSQHDLLRKSEIFGFFDFLAKKKSTTHIF